MAKISSSTSASVDGVAAFVRKRSNRHCAQACVVNAQIGSGVSIRVASRILRYISRKYSGG